MSITIFVFWLLVGMTGTLPMGPLDPPARQSDRPTWLVSKVIGGVAGIIGGWAYSQLFLPQDPVPLRTGLYAATTAVGAFVASRLATEIYSQFPRRPPR